jgi:formylglycine-generating enzyme required for sulfatase activity
MFTGTIKMTNQHRRNKRNQMADDAIASFSTNSHQDQPHARSQSQLYLPDEYGGSGGGIRKNAHRHNAQRHRHDSAWGMFGLTMLFFALGALAFSLYAVRSAGPKTFAGPVAKQLGGEQKNIGHRRTTDQASDKVANGTSAAETTTAKAGDPKKKMPASGAPIPPTNLDSALMSIADIDADFSRLKLQLIDLQDSERQFDSERKLANRLTNAMATGILELNLGDSANSRLRLVYVPPGHFQMGHTEKQRQGGATASSASHYDFSVPSHPINVGSGFFIGVYEVPRFQFEIFRTATQPEFNSGIAMANEIDRLKPATNIDWLTAMQFCEWIGQQNQVDVRLPTEIEWEYAARGNQYVQQFESFRDYGVVIGGPWPVNERTLDRGWCGTIGMRDNVQEWCCDAWDEKAYKKRLGTSEKERNSAFNYVPATDYSTGESPLRSVRGSSFRDSSANHDVALRRYKDVATKDDTIGFRVVVPVPANVLTPGE